MKFFLANLEPSTHGAFHWLWRRRLAEHQRVKGATSLRNGYGGGEIGWRRKPRPAGLIQDDSFDATASVTICAFISDETEAPLFGLLIEPNQTNGLRASSRLMVDKVTTVSKGKLGNKTGRLDDSDLLRLNQAVLVFLGLASTPRS